MSTIQDVAKEAGVSSATVSRALSAPELVSEKTRIKVLAAVDRLSYSPNIAAKNLRQLRSNKIVVSVPDISNPYFSQVIRGVEEAAAAAGYAVLLGDTRHEEAEDEQLAAMLRQKEADGLIILGHRFPGSLTKLVRELGPSSPVVNGGWYSPELGIPSAHIDNARAASEMLDHLYGLGHRRVGVVTGQLSNPLSRDRLTGVYARAKEAGLTGELLVVEGQFSIESGYHQAKQLLGQPKAPTALFCFSDEMAMGALQALGELGMTCPRDVSIAGFDDIRYAAHLVPALTTISQPMEAIGREAVALLVGALSGNVKVVRHVMLGHTLMARASTAAPPSSRP